MDKLILYGRRGNLMKKFAIALFVVSSLCNVASGIGFGMNEDSVIELQIASNSPTRINIEGEKITDIFVHPQEAAETVIHGSGCLIVLPQAGTDKINVTIFGENGTTQDLLLRFTAKPASPIRLLKFRLSDEACDKQIINKQQKEKKL